jgi:hypothetical protein
VGRVIDEEQMHKVYLEELDWDNEKLQHKQKDIIITECFSTIGILAGD